MNMLTDFGKALRKLRIDRYELLKHMADKLQMSASYLSSIETGKRPIPDTMPDQIVNLYQLQGIEKQDVVSAYESTITKATLDLQNVEGESRQLALSFARNFTDLSPHDIDALRAILSRKEGAE